MLHRCLLVLALLLSVAGARAQSSDTTPYFLVEFQESARQNVPALHSGAWAQHDGRWLFVTGRTDGLHTIVGPDEAFPLAFANGAFVVYDPDADQVWTASLDVLPAAIADPLRTTNAQFHQNGETLYLTGGYGVDSATSEKTTFGTLTAIDVPRMIDAVRLGTPIADNLRQIQDDNMAVTGGHLVVLPGPSGTYALIGGHFYAGEYLTSSEVQEYTDALRIFDIQDDGTTLAIANFMEVENADLYHRRDGNVGPTVDPATEEEGLGIYGGVFQPTVLRPYRTPIFIGPSGTATESSYESYFGHYTSPLLPIYDRDARSMHSVLIGGMGQFFVSDTDLPGSDCTANGTVYFCEDTLVPFLDDIVTLSVAQDGSIAEQASEISLPTLLGTNAAFFFNPSLPTYDNGVIDLRALGGRTFVGYMVGGLETSTPNAGWMGQPSSASNRMVAFYITPLSTPGIAQEQPQGFQVEAAAPNPFRSETRLTVSLDAPGPLTVEVFDLVGRRLATLQDGPLAAGPHTFTVAGTNWPSGVYIARVTGERGTATQRLVRLR